MKQIIGILLCVILIGCKTNKEEQLLGEWKTAEMIFSFNIDELPILQDTIFAKDFPEVMGIKEVKANYFEDGSFTSSYIGLDGNPIKTETGNWFVNKDSLYIVYSPNGVVDTFAYSFEIKENVGFFKSKLDWHSDGLKDDLIEMKSIKLN